MTTTTTTIKTTTSVNTRKKSASERGKDRRELAFERAGDKEQFLKGVDRFVACHGGDTVKTWIGGCIQGIDRNFQSRSRERQQPDQETEFDRWMREHNSLCQPFHAPAPMDCESPALRKVKYVIEGSHSMTPTSAIATQTDTEYIRHPTDVVVTPFERNQKHYGTAEELRHTLTTHEYDRSLLSPWSASKARGREKWSGRDTVGWRLGKKGSVHHPASCGTSPVRVRTLSPPKMFRYSDLQPTTPSAPPPTPVLLTPQRSVARSVRSARSSPSTSNFYSSPHRTPGSVSRCSCSPKTKTAVRKKLNYVWMPAGKSPSKRR